MPLPLLALSFTPTPSSPAVVIPAGGTSGWVTAVVDGGLSVDDLDGYDVIREAISIDQATHNILTRTPGTGTVLWIRMKYTKGDGAVADPLIVRVFGSDGDDPQENPYVPLMNLNGKTAIEVPTDVDRDPIFGSVCYTTPDNYEHAFDCKGYAYSIIGTERVYPGGDAEHATLEAKIV